MQLWDFGFDLDPRIIEDAMAAVIQVWQGAWLGSGEGNGNPLQYSCLENPMDGGAW